jgi:hypothetical protein
MSEHECTEHLYDEIERLRESNFELREGAEEMKERIKRLESDAISAKWMWMMNYFKTHGFSPTLGWESAEKAWTAAKEAKL